MICTPAHLEALDETFNSLFSSSERQNPKTSVFIVACSPSLTFAATFAVIPLHDGDQKEGRRIFKPLFDIGPVANLTKSHPYVNYVH